VGTRRDGVGAATAAVALALTIDLLCTRKLARSSARRSDARAWKAPVAPLPVSAGGVGWEG
jgi:hypothetical protein